MCTRPLKGFVVGVTKNGKQRLHITSYNVNFIEDVGNYQFRDGFDPGSPSLGKRYYKFVDLPCGRCIECRLQKSRDWANRAVLELQDHDSNLFITLTYNEKYLPISSKGVPTLNKDHLQKFWKRLRKHFPDQKIRYLACGEYGSRSGRSHYHAIVFGLKLDDLKPFTKNPLGDILYTSEELQNIWSDPDTKEPYGFVLVGEATWQSIAYVSRYVTKKKYGKESHIYEDLDIIPEFLTMSRKPGLARNYYEKNKEKLFEEGQFVIPGRDTVRSVNTPRYFNNLFSIDFDERQVSEHKEFLKDLFDDRRISVLDHTDDNYLDYLSKKEHNLIKRSQVLMERDLENHNFGK